MGLPVYDMDDLKLLAGKLDDIELLQLDRMWETYISQDEMHRMERDVKRKNKARQGKRGRPVGSTKQKK